jgi:peptidoglycan/LPS O-acetylase OafA/YrhL
MGGLRERLPKSPGVASDSMNLSHPKPGTVAVVPLAPDARSHARDAATAAHAEFLRRSYFGSLDALRALSIAGVIWHHAGAPNHAWRLLDRGAHGVTLFFAISGFLITTLLLRERERFGSISLPRFYARRTLRIFPLYFAVLGGFCAVMWWLGGESRSAQRFFDALPHYLTYTANWGTSHAAPFGYSWSLSAEEQFYLLWPPVLVLLGTRLAVWPLVGLLIAHQAAAVGRLDGILPPGSFGNRLLATVQPAIGLGVLLAVVLRTRRGHAALSAILGGRYAPVLGFAIMVGVLSLPPLDPATAVVIDVAMALVVASVVIPRAHVLAKPLGSWPLVRIGVVSYGMYLFHGPVMTGARALGLSPVLAFLASLVATWGLAELSFATFEKVFRRLKSRFERREPRPAVAAAARPRENTLAADAAAG